jgi:hypothetical protein
MPDTRVGQTFGHEFVGIVEEIGPEVRKLKVVSTGLGSTAWMRSVITGSTAIAAEWWHSERSLDYKPMAWDADYLQFAVREPFPSKASQAGITFGSIARSHALCLRSLMPENGVIFSDGIEVDFLDFNSGTEACIGLAERRGKLVV